MLKLVDLSYSQEYLKKEMEKNMKEKMNENREHMEKKMDDMKNKMDENKEEIQKSMKELKNSMSSMIFHALYERLPKGDIKYKEIMKIRRKMVLRLNHIWGVFFHIWRAQILNLKVMINQQG
jgi:DUF4097 and DUF4098 domain-containing protein YvlB